MHVFDEHKICSACMGLAFIINYAGKLHNNSCLRRYPEMHT